MSKKSLAVAVVVLLTASLAGTATADVVCPDSSRVSVTFTRTYAGNWNKGLPYDYVTIAPNFRGETFSSVGITIDVWLKNCAGQPLVGVPHQKVLLYNSALCICPGGNTADADTDINGHTTFAGLLRGGGSSRAGLSVYADSVLINPIPLPVMINSTDAGFASPCFTDAADLAALARVLGRVSLYDIRYDYNESGPPTIDAGDLAFFASLLGAACQ